MGKRLNECMVLRMGRRVERCRGSTSHGLQWAARQEALCFRRLMHNWYRLNECGLCVQSVSRGVDGLAVIGKDKPCVEECTGRDLWEHKERRERVGMREKRWQWAWGMWGEEFCEREYYKYQWRIGAMIIWDVPMASFTFSGWFLITIQM